MPQPSSSDNIEWFRYPFVALHDQARTWLTTETLLGLAPIMEDDFGKIKPTFFYRDNYCPCPPFHSR